MDAFTDPDIEELIFVKPTQVGGTEALLNMLGYVVAQDPSPALIVYPTVELAETASKNRIRPMINSCSVIAEKEKPNESKLLELQFDGMYVALSGANSPAALASRPIRYLLMDEVDKYPAWAGKEADPRSLARERTKTFAHNKKIFQTSTPTRKRGPIWQEWEKADDQRRFYVPCPHCGHSQTLRFTQIKWPEMAKTPDEAKVTAYYECEECKSIIHDRHKLDMLRQGQWISEKDNPGFMRVAFHLNAIYSPWLRFGDIAYEFLRSKNSPELLMNFVNSWLAEPWEDTEVKMNSDLVLERQSGYEELVVPDGTLLITAGVDVQRTGYVYTVRAWGEFMTSWNITHGMALTWAQIENIMNMPYYDTQGRAYQVNLCAVDSGDQTDEVYEFCAINQEWAVPVKGSSTPLTARYRISQIDRVASSAHGLRLYLVDGNQYKDMIAGRLNRPNGPGAWMVYKGCDRDYAEQICAEEKVLEKRGKQEIEVWKPKASHIDNHYLDAEVYCALAADLCHVRYLRDPTPQAHPAPMPVAASSEQRLTDDQEWIRARDNWLRG